MRLLPSESAWYLIAWAHRQGAYPQEIDARLGARAGLGIEHVDPDRDKTKQKHDANRQAYRDDAYRTKRGKILRETGLVPPSAKRRPILSTMPSAFNFGAECS